MRGRAQSGMHRDVTGGEAYSVLDALVEAREWISLLQTVLETSHKRDRHEAAEHLGQALIEIDCAGQCVRGAS